jgi:uncharacterized protein with HEPN domain
MPREYKLYLEDILESITKIDDYIGNMNFDDLKADTRTIDAIVRNLEVIGEATKNIPSEIKDKYPNIEWKKIAGIRDILIHAYFTVDLEILWDIVKNKLPYLKREISLILDDLNQ